MTNKKRNPMPLLGDVRVRIDADGHRLMDMRRIKSSKDWSKLDSVIKGLKQKYG